MQRAWTWIRLFFNKDQTGGRPLAMGVMAALILIAALEFSTGEGWQALVKMSC